MKKQVNPKLEVILKPSDFKSSTYINTNDCPLARALKRTLKLKGYDDVSVGKTSVSMNYFTNDSRTWIIDKGFSYDDYVYVREQYSKDPKMEKARYVVTLTEI